MTDATTMTFSTYTEFYNKRAGLDKAILAELLNDYQTNGQKGIHRQDLFKLITEKYVKTSKTLKNLRYETVFGETGDTYLNKALDLCISSLKEAGCLIDRGYGEGVYRIDSKIARFITECSDSYVEEIARVFSSKKDRYNVVGSWTKSHPETIRVVLVKKATGARKTIMSKATSFAIV